MTGHKVTKCFTLKALVVLSGLCHKLFNIRTCDLTDRPFHFLNLLVFQINVKCNGLQHVGIMHTTNRELLNKF